MKSNGGITNYDSKSWYNPYNLSEKHYSDTIDNIVYNKETMKINIKKKENNRLIFA